jgi:hypothetical protein
VVSSLHTPAHPVSGRIGSWRRVPPADEKPYIGLNRRLLVI